jgi:hypothetical protein
MAVRRAALVVQTQRRHDSVTTTKSLVWSISASRPHVVAGGEGGSEAEGIPERHARQPSQPRPLPVPSPASPGADDADANVIQFSIMILVVIWSCIRGLIPSDMWRRHLVRRPPTQVPRKFPRQRRRLPRLRAPENVCRSGVCFLVETWSRFGVSRVAGPRASLMSQSFTLVLCLSL